MTKLRRKQGLIRRSIVRLILIMLLGLASSVFWFPIQEVEAAGWLTGWSYRQRITINHLNVGGDLTNFPVLVRLTAARFDFTRARSDGFDIRFTAADGTTLLDYERERHDAVGARAEYWVRVPAVSGTISTDFFIYYGNATAADGANPTAVWDANTMASWRLREAGTGAVGEFRDSTINANHGRGGGGTAGAVPTQVEGKIAQAQSFDGVDDFVEVPDSASLNFGAGNYTLEFWFRWVGPDPGGFMMKRTTWWNGFFFWGGGNSHHFRTGDGTNSNHFVITHGGGDKKWHHLVITRTGTTITAYVNAIFNISMTIPGLGSIDNTGALFIGRGDGMVGANNFFDGLIDEVRISNIARSPAWIRASFHSGQDTLLTYGARKTLPTSVTVSPPTATLNIGATQQFTATVGPAGADQSVTWSVTPAGIGTITVDGLFTATAAGTATVRATSVVTTVFGEAAVTVRPNPTSATVAPATVTLNIGATQQFTATVGPAGADPSVTWTVTPAGIGTITPAGLFTATAAGTATVRATSILPAVFGDAAVTVTAPFDFTLSVSPNISVAPGGSGTTTVTATLTSGTATSVTTSNETPLPTGVTISNHGTITPTGSRVLIVGTTTATPLGNHTITINATGGGVTRTAAFTLTVTAPPAMERAPAAISLSLQQGRTTTRIIWVRNTGGGTLSWTKSTNVPWITGLPVSGTSTGEWDDTTITISAVGLAVGTHTGTITFAATGVASQTTPVTLTVTPPAPPAMERTPAEISLLLQQGITATRPTIRVRNTGGGTLSWTKSTNVPWITGLPVRGTSTGEWNDTTITISAVGLAVGTHTGIITFTATGGVPSQTTSVTLTVTPAPLAMERTPTGISLSLQQGTTATRTIGVRNTGGETLGWTKSTNVPWITGLPVSGTSTGEWDDTTITISAVGLTVGTHTGTITFTATGVASQTTSVTLKITAEVPPPAMERTPAAISLSLQQGKTATRTIGVRNTGGGTLSWIKSADVAWITGLPVSGTSTGEWNNTTITISAVGLAVGTHTGIIIFAATGVASQTIPVTLEVTAEGVTAPFVQANYPAHNATEVSLATLIMATFSKPMDRGATEAAFSISPPVLGDVTWSGNTIVFMPATALVPGITYTVIISTAARDVAGNFIKSSKTWSFTTTTVADITLPRIVEAFPIDKAIDVLVATNIIITFNESMRFLDTEMAVFISPHVPGAFTWDAGSVILTFTPVENLFPGTKYTIKVSTLAADSAGNRLPKEHSFSFTTAAAKPNPDSSDRFFSCFIATAVFGTPMAEEVVVLRRFRDQYLLTNELGRRFVSFYWRHSPALAEYISDREWAKRIVRIALLPLVRVVEFMVGE